MLSEQTLATSVGWRERSKISEGFKDLELAFKEHWGRKTLLKDVVEQNWLGIKHIEAEM